MAMLLKTKDTLWEYKDSVVDKCTKVRQNNLFKNNQSKLYKELAE